MGRGPARIICRQQCRNGVDCALVETEGPFVLRIEEIVGRPRQELGSSGAEQSMPSVEYIAPHSSILTKRAGLLAHGAMEGLLRNLDIAQF
jgi:hypothetical protein